MVIYRPIYCDCALPCRLLHLTHYENHSPVLISCCFECTIFINCFVEKAHNCTAPSFVINCQTRGRHSKHYDPKWRKLRREKVWKVCFNSFHRMLLLCWALCTVTRDSRKSWQKMVKNTAHFCKNRKNHGKITAVYIAANLLKLVVSQNTYHNDVTVTYSASK